MSNSANLCVDGNVVCAVEILSYTPPKREMIKVGPFLGDPTVEYVPGRINPGEVIFRCNIAIAIQLMRARSVELQIDNKKIQIIVTNIQNDVVTAMLN